MPRNTTSARLISLPRLRCAHGATGDAATDAVVARSAPPTSTAEIAAPSSGRAYLVTRPSHHSPKTRARVTATPSSSLLGATWSAAASTDSCPFATAYD